MNTYTEQLSNLINEAIDKFKKNHPKFDYGEIALNAAIDLTASLIKIAGEGKTLEEKFELLDDLVKLKKKRIEHDHGKPN